MSADVSLPAVDLTPPSRPRSVLVVIDGKRSVFPSVAEAFAYAARVYAADIREARAREAETACDVDECPMCEAEAGGAS